MKVQLLLGGQYKTIDKEMKKRKTYQEEEIPPHRAKKNTKKWCKGVVGRLHDPVWGKSRRHHWHEASLTCRICEKELGYIFRWWPLNQKRPSVNIIKFEGFEPFEEEGNRIIDELMKTEESK